MGVALSLVAIGFSVAPPAYARSPLCDTTPTLGQFVVCTYSDGASFQFEIPQSFGVWRATQVIIKLSGAGGGGGGGNQDFDGGDGGKGALVGAKINLPGDARSISVNLGAGGLGGSGVSSGRGNNGASGGPSTLSLNGLSSTQLILEASPGQGGSGANLGSGEAGLNRLGNEIIVFQKTLEIIANVKTTHGRLQAGAVPNIPAKTVEMALLKSHLCMETQMALIAVTLN